MIDLILQNNIVFVYNVKDWELLRDEYRIIGQYFGYTQYVPVLPISLLPEEVLLLLDKGAAQLIQYDYTNEDDKNETNEKNLLEEFKKVYRDARKKRIEFYIDKIVEGKHKKGDLRSREEIFKEELNKEPEVTEENMLWPIELRSSIDRDFKVIPKEEYVKTIKCDNFKIFVDLWEQGYYITAGHKFGADYLLYRGDPLLYHANYIVKCLESKNHVLHPTEIIAFGRLGTSVKKRPLLATINNDKVEYITLKWLESS